MVDWEIARMWRQQELERRQARRKCLANEIALEYENLSPAEEAADTAAKELMKQSFLRQDKATHPGYFRRLWAALLNK
jgi:hypothetical protein